MSGLMQKRTRQPELDDGEAEATPAVYPTPEEVMKREASDRSAEVTDQWWYRARDGRAELLRYRLGMLNGTALN